MIRLLTLGVLDLRAPDGRELGAVLRQPKRLGLLAYLAAASPRRFHRRDTLLALFWPDLDEGHARAALRRALYFLRAELGAAAIEGRGDEEVGVPEQALWSDAAAFDRALEAGNAAEALALYRGALLEGLHVAGAAPEFQEWLEGERLRRRDQAARAARGLVEQEEIAGHQAEAIGWARRALELSPEDEGAVRRLVGALARGGDRAGALRVYQEFAVRLAREHDLAPSEETRALAAALKAGESAPVLPPGASRHTIAVLPFAVRGEERLGYLREGLVDLLATKLDGAGDLRAVDPRALLHHMAQAGAGAADPAAARAVAARFGAGRFLLGSAIEAGGRLQLGATLYATDGGPVASAHASGAETELFALVDQLARQLLGAEGVGSGTRLSRLAAVTTESLDALKAHLAGERELRAGRNFDAMERFQAAVEADPSFALAHYRLAAAAAGCALPDLARESAERAHEYRTRLAPHDRLVLAAQRAWLAGQVGEAESLYNTITGVYPDDVEAWFHLGDLLFHANPLRGRSAIDSRSAFERVLRLRPDHVGALVHLARIAALQGRPAEMDELIGRVLRASPESDQALAMRALRGFARRDPDEMARLTAELQRARALTVAIAFADVALYARNLEGAAALARSFIEVARSAELRALCHVQLAHLAAASGRWEEAAAELGQSEALDRAWGLEVRALFALLPSSPATDIEIRTLRESLERWDPTTTPASEFLVFAMHNELHPALRLFLLGGLEVRLGMPDRARERAAALAGSAAGWDGAPAGAALVANLARGLEARIAAGEGRPEDAIRALEAARPELWFQLTVASPFFSLASERWLRAELLREVGRTEEAAGWYGAIAERSPYELVYAGPAGRRLAEIGAASYKFTVRMPASK